MSGYTYPYGYSYPNEFSEPLVWLPVMVAYSLLASGATLILIASIAYLTGWQKRLVPYMLLTGLGMYAVVLLGPLADVRAPEHSLKFLTSLHITPSSTNLGISLISLHAALLWPITFLLAAVFAVIYLSYPTYRYSLAGGRLAGLRRILSLGVSSSEKYRSYSPLLKALAVILVIPTLLWSMYPTSILPTQTANPIWRSWQLLPLTQLAGGIVVAGSATTLTYLAFTHNRVEGPSALMKLLITGSVASAFLLLLQTAYWYIALGDTFLYAAAKPISLWAIVAAIVFAAAAAIAYQAIKKPSASMAALASVIGIIASIINLWNILVNAQLASKTGAATLPATLGLVQILEAIAVPALAVVVITVLFWIFPVGGGGNE